MLGEVWPCPAEPVDYSGNERPWKMVQIALFDAPVLGERTRTSVAPVKRDLREGNRWVKFVIVNARQEPCRFPCLIRQLRWTRRLDSMLLHVSDGSESTVCVVEHNVART